MLNFPLTKQFCLPLGWVKCGLVSEIVTAASPHFCICLKINEISILGQPWLSKFTKLLSIKFPKILVFLLFFQSPKLLHLHDEGLDAHCNPTNSCSNKLLAKFLYTKIITLWVCTFFEGERSIPEHSHQKTLISLLTFISASSVSGTMQDILLQISTELNLEGVKAKK